MDRAAALRDALADLVLGRQRHQRLRASQMLLGVAVAAACAVAQHLEVLWGLIDARESWWATGFTLGGSLAFYLVIRSGLNLRWPGDKSLTLPQIAFALVSVLGWYAITGPARGAVVALMMLAILFAVFSLPARQTRLLTLGALAGLAGVMAWRTLGADARYDPRVELANFLYAAVALGGTAVLATRLGRLRARLSAQKAELAQALEINRQLATRDALTGLLNRRAMAELLAQEQPRQRRAGGPMTVALIDIDHFKRVNDQHGHAAGDLVLQRFAATAREVLRGGDALARWGGEEFLVLLPGTPPAGAERMLERLRERLQQLRFDEVAPGLQVGFSAGIARCLDQEPHERAIERADRALYRAKDRGRGRTELDQDEAAPA